MQRSTSRRSRPRIAGTSPAASDARAARRPPRRARTDSPRRTSGSAGRAGLHRSTHQWQRPAQPRPAPTPAHQLRTRTQARSRLYPLEIPSGLEEKDVQQLATRASELSPENSQNVMPARRTRQVQQAACGALVRRWRSRLSARWLRPVRLLGSDLSQRGS